MPPIVEISSTAKEVKVGQKINFEIDNYYDENTQASKTTWDFGDGNIRNAKHDEVVEHKYTKEGKYQVTLIVEDEIGTVGKDSVEITVTKPENKPPNAVINISPEFILKNDKVTVKYGEKIKFNASGSFDENGEIHIANKVMKDIKKQLSWSIAMPSTDGGSTAKPGESTRRVRPSAFSGMSDALIWVRERKLVTLEDMIRKMTSLAAHALRLRDRGLIKEGMRADLTVFDLKNIKSLCTYENDARPAYPVGIPYVIVNGVPVIDDNNLTKALPGKMLRHTSSYFL